MPGVPGSDILRKAGACRRTLPLIPYHSPPVWRFYPFRTGHLLMCCDAASTVREILHFTATKTISNTSHHLLDTRLCLLVVTLLSLKYLEKPEQRL